MAGSRSIGELQASRARLATALYELRERVERELDARVQQRLVLLRLNLEFTRRSLRDDADVAAAAITDACQALDDVIGELRDIAHAVHPRVLTHAGLCAALEEAVERGAMHATLRCDETRRYPSAVESAVYFSCVEGLGGTRNGAAGAVISLTDNPQGLRLEIERAAHPLDPDALARLVDHIEALSGEVEASPGDAGGTRVTALVPERID
jgi:signal transduction histidine kinase